MPLKNKLLNKIRSIDPTFYARNEILLKHSYLEDRILKTNLINKLLTLPSVLHYQQSVLIVLYFQVDLSDSMALQYFLSLIFLFFLFLLLLVFHNNFLILQPGFAACLPCIELYVCTCYICSLLFFLHIIRKTLDLVEYFTALI